MRIAYKYRLQPNNEQIEFFRKHFGCTRKLWNLMVHDYNSTGQFSTPRVYKTSHTYMKEIDSLALANVQQNLHKAIKNVKQNPKHFSKPVFKSKNHSKKSYTTNNQKNTVEIIDGKWLKLPKLKTLVRIKCHRQLKGIIKTATISETSTGKFYVSLSCIVDEQPLQSTGQSIGIDLGLTDLIITSDGEKFDNIRSGRTLSRQLSRAQRKLSRQCLQAKNQNRKLSDCKNYQKQKLKVAKIHEKIRNQRLDYLHKITTQLVKNHDLIVAESLAVKNLLKNRKLSRSISDAVWGTIIAMLTYKSEKFGRTFIQIDRWFASSQICSNCGFRSGRKTLDVRHWTCSNCDSENDRDINASINILLEGQRIQLQTI